MYYLARGGGVPTPAESPCLATLDDKHEWEYGQQKHQAALKGIKGIVDQSVPRSIDEKRLDVQARTRRFCDDQRRAEIGRENRKLVEKLASISRGTAGSDPRAPPPSSATAPLPAAPTRVGGGPRPSAALSSSGSLISEGAGRPKSLNDAQRRKTQRSIGQENASLLRRILAVKTTFDKRAETRDFQRHQRTVQLLQRLPGSSGNGPAAQQPASQRTSSLPPMRHPRPTGRLVGPAQGLEALLLPGDLQRCESMASSLGSTQPRAQSASRGSRTPRSAASRTPRSEPEQPQLGRTASSGGGARQAGTQRRGAPELSLTAKDASREPSAEWPQRDSETERRSWVAQREAASSSPERTSPQRGDTRALTGMSADSELKYADSWDDNSMTSSSFSPLKRSDHLLGGSRASSKSFSKD